MLQNFIRNGLNGGWKPSDRQLLLPCTCDANQSVGDQIEMSVVLPWRPGLCCRILLQQDSADEAF